MTVLQWPRAREMRLEVLIGNGTSFTDAAKLMGVTRNTIAGKATRMGLTPNRDAVLTKTQRSQRGKWRESTTMQARLDKICTFPPVGRCVYPHGDPDKEGFGFCGERIGAFGVPYCAIHTLVAYQPVTDRDKRVAHTGTAG